MAAIDGDTRSPGRRLRPGLELLADHPGTGPEIQRRHTYFVRLKLWLNRGQPVLWRWPSGLVDRARLEDGGATLVSDLRIDREHLIPGLFQGVAGMRVGGRRKLRISPHLAYGDRGIDGIIPPAAVLVAEIQIIDERSVIDRPDADSPVGPSA